MMVRFTVFTPTYNRGYSIANVYQSLLRQTFKDFEWIVIDDGSTDNTEEVVNRILQEKPFFQITYKKVENGGKHRAINRGLLMAQGEMFMCCDSDDYLTDDCLEVADAVEKSIPPECKNQFAGICGLRGKPDHTMIGTTFQDAEYADITYLQRAEYGITGDKADVLYTNVWRKYPFAEYPGEKFLTEYTGLSRIATDGLKVRFFNSIIRITEYLPDGLSNNIRQKCIQSPRGWGLYIGQLIEHGLLTGRKRDDTIMDYYRCCRKKMTLFEMADNLHISKISFLSLIGHRGLRRIKRTIKRLLLR